MDIKIWSDGSFDESAGVYGGGALVYTGENTEPHIFKYAEKDPVLVSSRNISGEITILIHVLSILKEQSANIGRVTIYYDYKGIECWVTREWPNANKPISRTYRTFMDDLKANHFDIAFVKVKAHSGVRNNEIADRLAKEAIVEYVNKESASAGNI